MASLNRLPSRLGATLWFTGLSASGKTTTAHAVETALNQQGYSTRILDGDELRHGLNEDLSFTANDRSENVRRLGEVAKLFSERGFITLVSAISPYQRDRHRVRELHSSLGIPFMEIYMNTPLEVCEARDPKGLYKKARSNELDSFTGITDPYEVPSSPELIINTHELNLNQITYMVLTTLQHGLKL